MAPWQFTVWNSKRNHRCTKNGLNVATYGQVKPGDYQQGLNWCCGLIHASSGDAAKAIAAEINENDEYMVALTDKEYASYQSCTINLPADDGFNSFDYD